jgi:hypothetical protein
MIGQDEAWQDLERYLTSLVESLLTKLDDENRKLLNDFVRNREYGVALEWLYSLVVERSIQLSVQQETEIRRLAELMGIHLDDSGTGHA